MSPELDKKLVAAFPNLYRNRDGSMKETAMCWGFECGDGWFNLLWDLSSKLEALIVALGPTEYPVCASQVKEKYGTLRFYMTRSTDEMEELISKAEALSAKTCEICGNDGEVVGETWFSARCEEHKHI